MLGLFCWGLLLSFVQVRSQAPVIGLRVQGFRAYQALKTPFPRPIFAVGTFPDFALNPKP